MTAIPTTSGTTAARRRHGPLSLSAGGSRALLALCIAAAVAVGFDATVHDVAARSAVEAGEDLTRLLRAMAALKAVMAAGAIGAVLWRLGSPVSIPRFALYALACVAMAAGPGLIWDMTYLRTGAALLHGGLLVTLLLLARDPAVGARLMALLNERRRARL